MNLTTLSENLRIARNEANEDTSLLDLTTAGDYANRPAVLGSTGVGVIDLHQPRGTEEDITGQMKPNGVLFSFTGGSVAGKTFGFRGLAWRPKGPAKLFMVGTAELGTQAVVTYPHNSETATNKFWAEKLVLTWTNWPIDHIGSTDETGHNSQAEIWLDNLGHRFFKIEITDADGSTGTEAGNVAAWWGMW